MSSKNISKLFIVLVLFIFSSNLFASLVVDHAYYQKAYYITSGGPQGEGGTGDSGGAVFIFVRNTGSTNENIWANPNGMVKCNGNWVNNISGFRWARSWPETIEPGKGGVIIVKGVSSPLAEGNNNHWEIWSASGSYTDYWYTNTVLPVVIGNVVPSRDKQSLYIFMRNNGDPWQTINQVFINGVDVTGSCTYVGSSGSSICQRDVKIIKVNYADQWQLENLKPLNIRVWVTNQSTGVQSKVGTFVRVTEPIFPIGTWSGDAFTSEAKVIEARSSFDHDMVGPDFRWDDTAKYAARYSLRGMPMPSGMPNPSDQDIAQYRYQPGIFAFYMDDEPERNNRSSTQEYNAANTAWRNDSYHPTMLNLCKNKVFQEYGLAVDHPCMDHYCQYAPLIYGGFLTTYSIKEALWYSESLKKNCEPLRMWSYVQGVSTTTGWRGQPQTWGIKIQFWEHIMGGAKGVKWFFAKDESGYTNQYNSIRQCNRELSMVRNIALYSDVVDSKVSVSHSDLQARMLIGEDAVVVPVVNGSGTYTNGITASVSMTDRNSQTITITVPNNIVIQQVKEVTQNGLTTPSYSQNGQTITITGQNFNQTTPHHVYLIGKNDTQAPDAPHEFQAAKWESTSTAQFAWDDAYDNYGIYGYKVYRNGSEIADVRTPYFRDTSAWTGNSYTVKAYDAAGNLSAASTVYNPAQPAWYFDDYLNTEGWSRAYSIFPDYVMGHGPGINWGVMWFWTKSAAQPNIYSPVVQIDAGVRKHVRIQYYNGTSATQACLYYTKDGGSNYYGQWFNITPANQWNWVDLDFTSDGNWNGVVNGFRLDLPGYGQGDWQGINIGQIDVY
jgi:hypothetical protein